MGKIIANPKNYTGNDLETVFFRPLVSGPDALELGIRMMYNMPVPTTLNFWKRGTDLLQKYSAGWNGSAASDKYQKIIELHKVKAEMGYAAEDYFSMVYERIVDVPTSISATCPAPSWKRPKRPCSAKRSPSLCARPCGWVTPNARAASIPSTAFSNG